MIRKYLLAVFVPILLAHLAVQAVGCASALKELESISDPSDDVKLSQCRKLARGLMADGGDAGSAYAAYYSCTEEAGLR